MSANPTSGEIAHDLSVLYLQGKDMSSLTPTELVELYYETNTAIIDAVKKASHNSQWYGTSAK